MTREDVARAALLHDMSGWVGADGARTIGTLVDRARATTSGSVASVLSVFVLLYASTRLFSALERAINVMWGVATLETPSVRDKALRQIRKRGMGLLMVLGVGAMFMALPAAKIAWMDAAVGALLTACLFWIGSHAVAAYVAHKNVSERYGDAGTVVMLLLWVQYRAQIFLIGAAFTGARARRRGTLGAQRADFVIRMPESA